MQPTEGVQTEKLVKASESCKGQRYLQGTEPKSKGLISRHGLVLGQLAADQKPLKSFLLS